MLSVKAIITIVVVSISLITIGTIVFSSSTEKTPNVTQYSADENIRPLVEVKDTFFDFGKIKVNETQTKDFSIKNSGKSILELFNITSSCGCTTGKIIYEGQESREFGMHVKTDYAAKIKPGTEAILRITYRPFQMPVYGLVEREVYISTNDPANQKLIFKVKAFVE